MYTIGFGTLVSHDWNQPPRISWGGTLFIGKTHDSQMVEWLISAT